MKSDSGLSAFGVDHGYISKEIRVLGRRVGRKKTAPSATSTASRPTASKTPVWDPAKAGEHYTPPASRPKAPTWSWKPEDAKGVAGPVADTATKVSRASRLFSPKKAAIAAGAGAVGGGAGGLYAAHRRR